MKSIRIIGSCPEKTQISELLRTCTEDLPCEIGQPVAVVLDADAVVPEEKFRAAAVPQGFELAGASRTVTYSTEDLSAGIVALNIQEKPEYTCFELMAEDRMGRVFVGNKTGFTVKAVLTVAAALTACGLPLAEVIARLNKILKAEL